ncbi:hypothetical protein PH213_08515 [Streptomyces sp. SRF1]|uniref:hypothetical protein n=1 Tax=Streptomyces sp. SRF1 TaxID=1549642 RepID=UPI0025AEDAB8|nr:hypothetical protein [Streptomyces sp. SRF1]MDN3054582.1 hypothetical protein [Streptomyces sp. SRF1]
MTRRPGADEREAAGSSRRGPARVFGQGGERGQRGQRGERACQGGERGEPRLTRHYGTNPG